MSADSQQSTDNWPLSAKRGLSAAQIDPEAREIQHRREVRRDAMRTAEGLVHAVNQRGHGPASAADMAQDLVDAADIIETGLLQTTPKDQTSQSVGAAQRVALGDY